MASSSLAPCEDERDVPLLVPRPDRYLAVLSLLGVATQADRMRPASPVVILLAVVACGPSGQDCTLAGAEPQVLLWNDAAPLAAGAVAEVCLDGECAAAPWRDGQAFVPVAALPRDGSVELQVRTLAADGNVIDEGRLSAEVVSFRPNGPGCAPEVGQVAVQRVEPGQYEQRPR